MTSNNRKRSNRRKRVLITLGPTQEPIDSVRYITNPSTGRMGKSLAAEAIKRGYETTLVAGPTAIGLPEEAEKIIHVRTAEQMIEKTMEELRRKDYDLFISTAAIADFTPAKASHGKIKSGADVQITLKSNPKLTKMVRDSFPEMRIVAFKAEHNATKQELLERARNKLVSENLNLVVANDITTSMGEKSCEVYLLDKSDDIIYVPLNAKEVIAMRIWDKIEKRSIRLN